MNKYCHLENNIEEIRTTKGIPIARGFLRIVHGQRGAYVEIPDNLIIRESLHIPDNATWREDDKYRGKVYYIEYRSTDGVKFYYQKRYVDYADYLPGMWYVSPKDLQDFEIVGIYNQNEK